MSKEWVNDEFVQKLIDEPGMAGPAIIELAHKYQALQKKAALYDLAISELKEFKLSTFCCESEVLVFSCDDIQVSIRYQKDESEFMPGKPKMEIL